MKSLRVRKKAVPLQRFWKRGHEFIERIAIVTMTSDRLAAWKSGRNDSSTRDKVKEKLPESFLIPEYFCRFGPPGD